MQNDLAKVIEETRQSIRQEEPKRSVIDDNLQALETARLDSEKRRRADEENQRASLTAALKQFEALETRKRAEPEAPIDLGVDARTGTFLAPPEPAMPEKAAKLQDELQHAFEADQAKAVLEREQSVWTDSIRRAEEGRVKDSVDTASINSAQLEAEESRSIAKLAEEDTQRMNAENERAQGIQKQIEALMKQAPAAPEVTQKSIEPARAVVEQDILQTLENARKNLETNKRAETVLPDAPEETAKPKMEPPQSAPVPQEEKYGFFMDPADAPKAKKPVEELRTLMFPPEPTAEPMSSKLPDIGRMPRTEDAAPQAVVHEAENDSAKVIDLNVTPAQPVSVAPAALNFEEKGITVIAEPEGSIQEDTFREANKRVKSKFVVPGNAPAPFGRRAEVINLDQ